MKNKVDIRGMFFSTQKHARHRTTFTTHSTTTSPQKHNTQNTHFPKTPLKNAH
jgi:hypothetical protein